MTTKAPAPDWRSAYEAEHALRMALERRLELADAELAARPAKPADAPKLSSAVERACLNTSYGRDDFLRDNRKIAAQMAAAGCSDTEIIIKLETGVLIE